MGMKFRSESAIFPLEPKPVACVFRGLPCPGGLRSKHHREEQGQNRHAFLDKHS